MKLMMKFSTKSLSFEIYFLSFPWEIVFRCYFRQLYMYLALKNVKMTVKYLKSLWYRFLPLKSEIARSSIGFSLKTFHRADMRCN